MKIRVQLALMMAAVVAPLALVAGASTYALYESQREVHSQRYLERVRGLRLALDTELLGTVRLLGAFASRQSLTAPQPPDAQQMADPLQRILLQNPLWSSIMLIENDGSVVARTDRPGITLGPVLDTDTRLQVVRSGQPAVSNLVALPGGAAYYTYVAVPIVSGTRVLRMAAIGIHQRNWLAFLRSYPIAEGATLTLNDARGMIIARTLNNDQWVGKKSRQDFLDRAAASNEGAFVNPGLEGQSFYSAYSRLTAAPWMLGTGVPADTVEAALRSQTLLLCGGLLLAALVAAAVATTLGRDITRALHSLADASRRPASDIGQAIERPLAIVEAESVRRLLRDTLLNETGARAEAEMAREQAERANKGKDEFLAMLAHELRNPLSAMSASVALLGAKNANAQTDRHAIEVLRRQAGQMSMLVNDLLDAARANSGKLMLRRADVDLAQLVASVVRAFQHSGRTEHLRVSTSLEPAVVQADAMRLEQVVANLLDNAAKFTAAGGRVQVTLQVVGATATLTIADDGIGIDPALLPHLFDPFTQAEAGLDRTRGGLGLGLHVVKRLAELHGGSVEAHSDGPARGARFTLRLPALTSTAPAAPADAIGPAEGLAPLRVVLVEDNADVREAAARLLHLAGHDTRSAVDGHSGLQLVLEDQPDVALIDIGLPGLDGLEIARRLRGRGTLLLALTAYGDDSMRTQAQQAGFDGFLQKPFDLRAFEFAVLAARARREQTA